MTEDPQSRLRAICLGYPEAAEVVLRRGPTYRVRGKIFALDRVVDRRLSLWCKAPPGAQQFEIDAAPGRYFAPPYYGPKGWLGAWLDDWTDWDDIASLIERSYLLIAPAALRSKLK